MSAYMSSTFNRKSWRNSVFLFMEGALMRTVVTRPVVGMAILVANGLLMGPAMRVTNDIPTRIVLLPVFFAVAGLGLALIYFGRDETS